MSRYIVRCPNVNHLGYPYWDKVILIFLNCRTQLHNVFDKHKSLIDQIILKYTNKVILGYRLGIVLLVIWYVKVSWGNLLAIHTRDKTYPIFLMVIFDFIINSMKINLN